MEIKQIILCRGIQGSGKTTFAKQWVLEEPTKRVRYNNDDIRNMLGKYWVPERENIVSNMKKEFIKQAMIGGYDIIIDNMNLNQKEVGFYNDVVAAHNNHVEELREKEILNPQADFHYDLTFKDFFISVDECVERDSKRQNPIGEEVIRQTYERYKDILN